MSEGLSQTRTISLPRDLELNRICKDPFLPHKVTVTGIRTRIFLRGAGGGEGGVIQLTTLPFLESTPQ